MIVNGEVKFVSSPDLCDYSDFVVASGKEEVFYRIYGMCSECFEHVNKHRDKFIKEFEHNEKAKSNYNKPG